MPRPSRSTIHIRLTALLVVSLLTLWLNQTHSSSYAQGPVSVVIAPMRGGSVIIETDVLTITNLNGFDGNAAGYTYQWYRSAGQDASNYQPSQDTDPGTGANRYNLDSNGSNDVGHRFYVQVSDGSGHTAASNVVAVGPRQAPTLLHPAANEEIRVNQPYFNIRNAPHDGHNPPNPPGSYIYEIQIASDNAFNTVVASNLNVAEMTGNNDVTYWQAAANLNGGLFWRARSKIANAPGDWSAPFAFTIANVWSANGAAWHWPLDNAAARLSGTFKEGYFHSGYLGSQLHGGIDISGADACGDDVRAVRSGLISAPVGSGTAVTLNHQDLKSSYLHMNNRTTQPRGVFINQGSILGNVGTVATAQCHLHFDILATNNATYYNPLAYVTWNDAATPTVPHSYLRSGRTLNTNATGIAGTTFVIAETRDQEGGNRLAPYRVQFSVNGTEIRNIQFDNLTNGETETDYYGYQTAARGANPPYLLYAEWNTGGLADDAGPQTIRMVSSDFNAHQGNREMVIGPDLTASPSSVTIDRCRPESKTVTLTINNRNNNIEGQNSDTYQLTLQPGGVSASLSQNSITINNGASGNVTLTISGTSSGTVRVIAASGIVRDVRDAVNVTVSVVDGPGCDHSDDNHSAASGQILAPVPLSEEPTRVAILFNGFAPAASGFVNALREPNVLVNTDFSPDIVADYPLLVIPSGGLYGLENSAFFRARLEEYTARGGTLIVFDQQRGAEYSVLPGGGLNGYGWSQDNSCNLSSLYIRNYDQVLSGFNDAILNSNVDGYFTDLPQGSDVLLWRAKNGQPAMVRYAYGTGQVIATTAYDDWGVSNWQTTADAYILNRDLLAWAVDPALLTEYDPGQPISLPLLVSNNSLSDAATVELTLLAPGKDVIGQSSQTLNLAAGGSATVTFSGVAATPLGIWRVDYTLRDALGQVIQPRTPGERFVVKSPHPLSSPLKEVAFSLNAPTERFIAGTNGEFTFTLFNNSAITRTLQVRYGLPHHTWETGDRATYGNFSDLSRTVVVGPNSQAQFVHVFPMRTNDRLFAYLYENGAQKDQTWFQTRKATAVASTTLTLGQQEYGHGQTVAVTAGVTNLADLAVNFNLDLRVTTPAGALLFSEQRPLALTPGVTKEEAFAFVLPADAPNGTYRVQATVTQENIQVSGNVSGFTLPTSPASVEVGLPAALPPTASDVLRVTISNPHAYLPVNGVFTAAVTDPNGATLSLPASNYNLAAGANTVLDFDLSSLPARFSVYRFDFTSSDQYSQRAWSESRPVTVNTALTFDQPSYQVRQTLAVGVRLSNSDSFAITPQMTLSIPDLSFTQAQTVSLAAGQTRFMTVTLPLPPTLGPGFHAVDLSVGLTNVLTDSNRFLVPPSRVVAFVPQTDFQAGDAVPIQLRNLGGVDAPVTTTLSLVDVYAVSVATATLTTTVEAGTTMTLTLLIPTGAASGFYYLDVDGQNLATGATLTQQAGLNVTGVAASLGVRTGQPEYFSDEEIDALADILVSSGVLAGNDLNLRICSDNSSNGSADTSLPEPTYQNTTVPINWIDISEGGQVVAVADNTSTLVNIGFSFQFYGTAYTQMYVGSNGLISFGAGYTTSSNTAIPSLSTPNNAIYALWDDLYPIGGSYGNIFVQQVAPTRTIVQWERVAHCCSLGSPETFQVILDGSNHSITLQYQDVSLTSSATVGVENSTGVYAKQIAYNLSDVITDGLALRFTPTPETVNQVVYNTSTIPLNWIEIAQGGQVVAVADNTSTLVNIGFSFQFYGSAYTQMYVGSNGLISFGAGYTTSSNGPIPSVSTPNNAIYALWDDLYPIGNGYGNVFVQQVAPTRTVVQWERVAHCCALGSPETFQVILDGSDHSITLQYQDISLTSSATVGVENSAGIYAIQLAFNQAGIITDGLAVKFTPGPQTIEDVTYASAAIPLNWVDISGGGTVVAAGDNVYSLVNIGFPFEFYGNTYTQVYVDANGYINFDGYGSYPYNEAIPSYNGPNNAIYALWDDLYPAGGDYGNVYVQQVAPTRTVIQWERVDHCCGLGTPETFQIILDGANNSITLQYLAVSDVGSATVGVEDGSGAIGVQLSFNQTDVITNGLAIQFAPTPQVIDETSYDYVPAGLNWVEISTTGQIVAEADDTYELVPIGFPFEFYGQTYTDMYVGSNGYVSFGAGFTNYSNDYIPTYWEPNNAIYALWDDLYPAGTVYGNVYFKQIDATHTVVQWQAVAHCCSVGEPETFEIILNGADNSITLQYLDVTMPYYATVGVENGNGSLATQIAYSEPGIITDSVAFLLTPITVPITISTYVSTSVPFTWEEIAPPDDTRIVAVGNDTYTAVDLGFSFRFYGIDYSQMYVGSNGFVSFGSGYTQYSNTAIPNSSQPNNAIYALWDDLYPQGGVYGTVYTRQISPTRMVVQWDGVAHCCSVGSPETFEIILDGSDNSITLQYLDVSFTSSATVGVENDTGVKATQIAYNQSGVIVDGFARQLTPVVQLITVPGYTTANIPLAWQEIAPSDTTNVVAVGDNTSTQVNLASPFTFYGNSYSQMYVNSNGFLSFGSGYTTGSNSAIPSTATPNNAIYGFWDDLYPIGSIYGAVYTQQINPNLYLVEWKSVGHCCSNASLETFEILINSADNSITLQYLDVTSTGSATVGVENESGTVATQLVNNQSGIIVDGMARLLTPAIQAVTIPSYVPTTTTINWQEIAPPDDTLVVATGDNTFTQVNLGFPFELYGMPYTSMYVGSNGFLSFGNGYTHNSNGALPNPSTPNNAIYALWDDLYPIGAGYGQIYARQTGPTTYVVQWDAVGHCCSATSLETFEVILDGSNHTFRLQYLDVASTSSATVGVENSIGAKATQVVYNQAGVIIDGLALNFTPTIEEPPPPKICDPQQVQPLNMMLVIDRSGSMGGQPIIDAKAAAVAFVDLMNLDIDQVGLASFASTATLDTHLTQDGNAVKVAINNLIASGSTAIGDGLAVGQAELVAHADPDVAPVMVLLSDGYNNAGQDPINAASVAKAAGTYIVTIGLGTGVDTALMQAIASTPSDFYYAPTSSDLAEIFASIAGGFCRQPLPYADGCGFVLWEETVPVTTTNTLSVARVAGPLNMSGRLKLDGRLFAETGQLLSHDQYPFYLFDPDTRLMLETDKDVYRPNETIQVTTGVTNTSALATDMVLRLYHDNESLLAHPLTLAVGQGYSYQTALTATTTLTSTNFNLAASANGLAVFKTVTVSAPQLAARLDAPDVVGRAPFGVSLTITNTGIVPAYVSAAINSVVAATPLSLTPGQSARLAGTLSITQDMVLQAPLSGDLNTTLTHPIIFGEAAEVSIAPQAVYPVGSVEVPYTIHNTGLLSSAFTTVFTLFNSNGAAVVSLGIPVDLPAGESQNGLLPLGYLPADSYTLEYEMPFGEDSADFLVIAHQSVHLSAVAGPTLAAFAPVTATVTNDGLDSFSGQVTLQTSFFAASAPVVNLAAGQALDLPLPVDVSAAVAGDHPAHLELLDLAGRVVDQADVTLNVPGPNLILTDLPTNLTLPVSATVTMTFGVANQGAGAGAGTLSFAFSDYVDEIQNLWLPGGEEGDVSFSFFVPPDIEAKVYPAPYTFNDEPGVLYLTVQGIAIDVTPSLDKAGYYEGETALLTLHIHETANRATLPLYALVRFNTYSEKQPFQLAALGSIDLTFSVPVSFLGDEKVFYGIYAEASDASIHLNTIYLPQLRPDVAILTDKQVYEPGETVVATVVTTATGQLEVSAPGFSGVIPLPGHNTSFTFTLPTDIMRGTYSVDGIPRNCQCLHENETLRTPFDVAAPEVRVVDAQLDIPTCETGVANRLTLTVASDEALTSLLRVWLEQPDGAVSQLAEQTVALQALPFNLISIPFTPLSAQSGVHRVRYELLHVAAADLTYAVGAEACDAGQSIVVSVVTDKPVYTAGEAVLATTTLYALQAGPGHLALTVDGAAAGSQTVNLVGGFQPVTLNLGAAFDSGAHDVQAVLTQAGLSSQDATQFDYGADLPDLVMYPPLFSNSGSADRRVELFIVNAGATAAPATTIALYDAQGQWLGSLATPPLAAGASHTGALIAALAGQAGSTVTLTARVDPDNAIVERREDNNQNSAETHLPSTVEAGPDQTSLEGQTISLSGAYFTGPDPLNSYSATLNWEYQDDLITPTLPTITISGTLALLSGDHTYLDDNPYTVVIEVCDQNGFCAQDSFLANVLNVAPSVEAGPDQAALVGDLVSLTSASFSDPGVYDVHSAEVDWGDGTSAAGSVSENNGAGSVAASHTYTHNGEYLVQVSVCDDDGGCSSDTFTVSITGGVDNTAPEALPDSANTTESVAVTINVLANDSDADNDPLSVIQTTTPAHGTVVINPDSSLTYTPAADFVGVDSFNYTISDGQGGTATANVTVTVANVAPVVNVGPDVIIYEGQRLLVNGSFSDPGANVWTGTVNYGDGTGTQPLALRPDKSFELNHVYPAIGRFTITATISDNHGGVGSDSLQLTVLHGFAQFCIHAFTVETDIQDGSVVDCNIGSWKKLQVRQGAVVNGYVFSLNNRVVMGYDARVQGNVTAAALVEIYDRGVVGGSVASGADIALRPNSLVVGNATATGRVTLGSGAVVNGVITQGAPPPVMPPVTLVQVTVVAGVQDITVPNYTTYTLPPGSYKKLVVGEGATLILQSGQYSFEQILLNKFAVLNMDLSGGNHRLLVNVQKDIDLKNGVRMLTNGAANQILFRSQSGHVVLLSGGVYVGTFLSPLATLELHEDSTLTGALYGRDIFVKPRVHVTGAPALDWLVSLYVP